MFWENKWIKKNGEVEGGEKKVKLNWYLFCGMNVNFNSSGRFGYF